MLGLHLVKCLAATQGPKVRVNAILPGLLLTEWVSVIGNPIMSALMVQKGANFTPEHVQSARDRAYLKMEVRDHGYCIER
jgi:NAD(P)-dependent dehydrogenase (short-subunit alcohol dehydrogenase family)